MTCDGSKLVGSDKEQAGEGETLATTYSKLSRGLRM